jgi:tetratricopeptide (TPR) repeat protein
MENQDPEEASPAPENTGEDTSNQDQAPHIEEVQYQTGSSAPGSSRRSWIWMAITGLITLAVIAGMAAVGGVQAGQNDLLRAEGTLRADQIQEQYDLALRDIESGRDDLARQRFEWIIAHDPGFPGVPDQLANVILRMSITASPTPAATPTLTPTPDTRSRDELYLAARHAMANREWSEAIDTLLLLRKTAPDFHTVEVDGWLYVALRYRGLEKIKNADLEGGTYDLALAERFGPLDAEATNYRSWAELYVTGASFWDVDWAQAIFYFNQLRTIAPYLRDGSGWTSIDRYRLALSSYGDFLGKQGLWCDAQEQYQASLEVLNDPRLQPTATYAAEQCLLPPEEEVPAETLPLTTPTPEGYVGETATPTPTPELEVTPTPTEEQAPTSTPEAES